MAAAAAAAAALSFGMSHCLSSVVAFTLFYSSPMFIWLSSAAAPSDSFTFPLGLCFISPVFLFFGWFRIYFLWMLFVPRVVSSNLSPLKHSGSFLTWNPPSRESKLFFLHAKHHECVHWGLKWGSINCRWRYWSRMIACCEFSLIKNIFIGKNDNFFF